MKCEICGKTGFKNKDGVRKHLCQKHPDCDPVDYYDQRLRKQGEGICQACGAPTTFISFGKGYRRFCSCSCATGQFWSDDENRRIRTKQIVSGTSTEEAIQKRRVAISKSWRTRSKEARERSLANIRVSGEEHQFGTEKHRQAMIRRYGADNYFKTEEFQERMKGRREEIEEKKRQTHLKRRGVKHYAMTEDWKERFRQAARRSRYELFLIQMRQKQIEALFDRAFFIEATAGFKYRCLRCGLEFEGDSCVAQLVFCPSQEHKYTSAAEDEIEKVVSDLGIASERNRRFYYDGTRYHEIDVFLPGCSVGIEHHGAYWHSDLFKDKSYHREKYLFFREKGIRLIQIFDSEMADRFECVKSLIRSAVGKNVSVYARQCEVAEVPRRDEVEFLEQNHIQGSCIGGSLALGLFRGGEIVAVAVFGKARYRKDFDWELLRFCSKAGLSVIGGLSRLLKRVEGSIVSYCDVRLFDGRGYEKVGFQNCGLTQPNYYYFRKGSRKLQSRVRFQKHKLPHILDDYDPSLSECENMMKNGYYRIFDAGMLRFERKTCEIRQSDRKQETGKNNL